MLDSAEAISDKETLMQLSVAQRAACFCFNTCADRPLDVPEPRPDHVRSRMNSK